MNQVEVRRRQIQAVSIILTLVTLMVVAHVTGYNGAAYTAAAVEAFGVVWLIVGGKLADALGRLLRIRTSKGQHKNADRLRRNTLFFQLGAGLAGSLLLLVGADWISRTVFKVQYSTFILMVMAPAVTLRSVSTVFMGYFQGEGTELPTAAAELFRQISILVFSLIFGRMLADYGNKVSRLLVQENFTSMYGGVGVGIAVSVSEVFVVLFLFLLYRLRQRSKGRVLQEGMRTADSFVDSVRTLCAGRSIQWLTGILAFLPLPLGFVFLQKSSTDDMTVEYGVYGAGYLVLCGAWTALILIFLYPICARSVSCLRKDEQRFAKTVFQCGVHLGVVQGAFAAMFLTVMASQLAAVFCAPQADLAKDLLQGGGLAVPLLGLSVYFVRLLNSVGGKIPVMGVVGMADVVFVVSVTMFLNAGRAGVLSLVYAGLMGLGVLCILLGTLAYRQLRTRPDWLQILAVPVGAACVGGLSCMLISRGLTRHLGEVLTLLVALLVSGAIYWVVLLLLRNFREQELEVIPGGRLIRALGQMLRVLS